MRRLKSNCDYFGLLAVTRDKFVGDIHAAKRRRKERRDNMNENLRAGSPAFLKEQSALFDDYQKEVSKARREALESIEEGFTRAEAVEKAKLRGVADASATLRALETLRGLPVSAAEFGELVEMFGGRSVWSDKALKKIGEENGINTRAYLEADFSEKMAVLSELREKFKNSISEFNIESSDIDLLNVSLSDPLLRIKEEQFTNGFVNYEFTAERRALALLDECKAENNPFVIASRVCNLLETADIKTAQAIVTELEKGGGYWQNIIDMGGLSRGLQAFKEREKAHYTSLAEECASLDLVAEVSRLTPGEKAIAREHSNANKINKKGLSFLRSEEGQAELSDLESVSREFREQRAEENKAAEERAEIEKEQAHINQILKE